MKNSILTSILSCLVFTLFSCSNDDEIVKDLDQGKTKLSFAAVLNDMASGREALKQQLGNIPQCSEEAPAFVEVVVAQAGVPVAGTFQQPLRLDVHLDSQGIYFTGEAAELELDPGIYSLEFFRVIDANQEVIWIAPREEVGEINFAGLVDTPLPQEIDLRAGTKKYVDVDVICYDNRLVNYYGYLFFDLQTNQAIKFCLFGNYCDENGRHIDAVAYSVNVWIFSGDDANPRGTVLYENLENAIWISDDFENGISETGTSPVCVALPDTRGQDQYYFEISIVGGVGGSAPPSLIRRGVITDEDVRSLYDGEDRVNYYHFREGNCTLGDSPNLFEVTGEPTVEAAFLPALQSFYDTQGTHEWVHEFNDEGLLIKSYMYERFPYRLLSEFEYSGHWGPGFPFNMTRTIYSRGNVITSMSELSYTNGTINMISTRNASGNFMHKIFLMDFDAANRVTEMHYYGENDNFIRRDIREYNAQGRVELFIIYTSETGTSEADILWRDINTYNSFGELHTSRGIIRGVEYEMEYFYRDNNTLMETRTVQYEAEPIYTTIRYDENETRSSQTTVQGNNRTEYLSFFPNETVRTVHYYHLDILIRTITYNDDRSSTWKIIEEDQSYRIEYKDAAGAIYRTEYYNANGELLSTT